MKLSTEKLKVMIAGWMAQKPKSDLAHYVEGYPEPSSKEQLIEYAKEFGYPEPYVTLEGLIDHLHKVWCDPDQWKRGEKSQLKDNWIEYLGSSDYGDPTYKLEVEKWEAEGCPRDKYPWPPQLPVTEFPIDDMGDGNPELLAKYSGSANEKLARKCIVRSFIPKNDHFANNYALTVVTTPEDDAVIGWSLGVD